MAEITEKTALCRVTYDGYDWRNLVTVKSPKGSSITFRATFAGISPELIELFRKWDYYYCDAKFGTGKQIFDEEIPVALLREMHKIFLEKGFA